jgi:integrase
MKFALFEQLGRAKPFGVRYWLGRKAPVRAYYATAEEARKRQAKLQEAFATGGLEAVKHIDDDTELIEAQRLAEEAGESILVLVRRGLSASKQRPNGGITLRAAFDGFMRRGAKVRLRTNRFIATKGDDHQVGEITREVIRRYVDSRRDGSQPHALRAIRAWLRWMLRQDPPLIPADPSAGMAVELPKEERKPDFLTDREAATLLEHCGASIRPAIALMLFAGIRVEEIYRLNAGAGEDVLRWEDVDFAHEAVYIRSQVAKTRVARTLRKLPANLWQWLPKAGEKKGPVCTVRLRARLETARKAAGLTRWAKSILRHTFASHHVAAYGDLSATALLLRHEGDVELLNRRYREGVHITEEDGKRFFALVPKVPKPEAIRHAA